LARPDQDWWDRLSAVDAEVLLLDLGAARSDNRSRLRQLENALLKVEYRDLSGEKNPGEPGGAAERALIAFMA
jgi:hypothetical protein